MLSTACSKIWKISKEVKHTLGVQWRWVSSRVLQALVQCASAQEPREAKKAQGIQFSWNRGFYCNDGYSWDGTFLCVAPCHNGLGEYETSEGCKRACGDKGFLPSFPAPCTNFVDHLCAKSGGECWKKIGSIAFEIFNVVLSVVPGAGKLASFAGKMGKLAFMTAVKQVAKAAKKLIMDTIKDAFVSLAQDKLRTYMADVGIMYLLASAGQGAAVAAYAAKMKEEHQKEAGEWAESLGVELLKAADPTGISGLVGAMTVDADCDAYAIEPFPCSSQACLRSDGILDCEMQGNCHWFPVEWNKRCANYKDSSNEWTRLGPWSGEASVFGCNELCLETEGCDMFSYNDVTGACLFTNHSKGCVAEDSAGFNIYYKFVEPKIPSVDAAGGCKGTPTAANSLSECHQIAISSGADDFSYLETGVNLMQVATDWMINLSILELVQPELLQMQGKPGGSGGSKGSRSSIAGGKRRETAGSKSSINKDTGKEMALGSGNCTICYEKFEKEDDGSSVYSTDPAGHGNYVVSSKNPPPAILINSVCMPYLDKDKVQARQGVDSGVRTATACWKKCRDAGSCTYAPFNRFTWNWKTGGCFYMVKKGSNTRGCELEQKNDWAVYDGCAGCTTTTTTITNDPHTTYGDLWGQFAPPPASQNYYYGPYMMFR